jgi:hypothetical protein
MPTNPLSTIHLPMPDDFDIASYEGVASLIAPLHEAHPDSWPEYAGGWSAIGYRFYACGSPILRKHQLKLRGSFGQRSTELESCRFVV